MQEPEKEREESQMDDAQGDEEGEFEMEEEIRGEDQPQSGEGMGPRTASSPTTKPPSKKLKFTTVDNFLETDDTLKDDTMKDDTLKDDTLKDDTLKDDTLKALENRGYKWLTFLGKGPNSWVVLMESPVSASMERRGEVAIKIPIEKTPAIFESIQKEKRLQTEAAKLGLAPKVYNVDQSTENFIVMQPIRPGWTLERYLQERLPTFLEKFQTQNVPVSKLLLTTLLKDILRRAALLHVCGKIHHCDITPNNVMFSGVVDLEEEGKEKGGRGINQKNYYQFPIIFLDYGLICEPKDLEPFLKLVAEKLLQFDASGTTLPSDAETQKTEVSQADPLTRFKEAMQIELQEFIEATTGPGLTVLESECKELGDQQVSEEEVDQFSKHLEEKLGSLAPVALLFDPELVDLQRVEILQGAGLLSREMGKNKAQNLIDGLLERTKDLRKLVQEQRKILNMNVSLSVAQLQQLFRFLMQNKLQMKKLLWNTKGTLAFLATPSNLGGGGFPEDFGVPSGVKEVTIRHQRVAEEPKTKPSSHPKAKAKTDASRYFTLEEEIRARQKLAANQRGPEFYSSGEKEGQGRFQVWAPIQGRVLNNLFLEEFPKFFCQAADLKEEMEESATLAGSRLAFTNLRAWIACLNLDICSPNPRNLLVDLDAEKIYLMEFGTHCMMPTFAAKMNGLIKGITSLGGLTPKEGCKTTIEAVRKMVSDDLEGDQKSLNKVRAEACPPKTDRTGEGLVETRITFAAKPPFETDSSRPEPPLTERPPAEQMEIEKSEIKGQSSAEGEESDFEMENHPSEESDFEMELGPEEPFAIKKEPGLGEDPPKIKQEPGIEEDLRTIIDNLVIKVAPNDRATQGCLIDVFERLYDLLPGVDFSDLLIEGS